MSDDLDYRIAKLEVKPGDVLVARFDAHLTAEQVNKARSIFKGNLPDGVNVLILPHGCNLSVLTFDEIQSRMKSVEAA